jgi:hypothetical protein
MINPYA